MCCERETNTSALRRRWLSGTVIVLCAVGCAPTAEKAEEKAAAETIAEIQKQEAPKAEPPAPSPHRSSGSGRSWKQHAKDDWGDLGHNLKEDIKGLWAEDNLAHNVIVLGGAGALTGVSIDQWDTSVKRYFKKRDRLEGWDELGNVLGHPGAHWGIMGLLYARAKSIDDPKQLETSKRLAEALILNDLTTLLLKAATCRNRPW